MLPPEFMTQPEEWRRRQGQQRLRDADNARGDDEAIAYMHASQAPEYVPDMDDLSLAGIEGSIRAQKLLNQKYGLIDEDINRREKQRGDPMQDTLQAQAMDRTYEKNQPADQRDMEELGLHGTPMSRGELAKPELDIEQFERTQRARTAERRDTENLRREGYATDLEKARISGDARMAGNPAQRATGAVSVQKNQLIADYNAKKVQYTREGRTDKLADLEQQYLQAIAVIDKDDAYRTKLQYGQGQGQPTSTPPR